MHVTHVTHVTNGWKVVENICLSPLLHWLHFLCQLGYPVKKSHMSHMLRMSQGMGIILKYLFVTNVSWVTLP